MRTPIIAGNWKMNMTIEEGLELVKGIHFGHKNPGEVDVIVSPPYTATAKIADFCKDSYIAVSGQNLYWEDNGAFTGEIPGGFLKDAGCDYVIIGHSERRQYFGETNDTVNKRTKAAYKHGLTPIVCIGETLDQREANQVESVLSEQVKESLDGLSEHQASELVLAYEPVWAIGTGKTASAEQVEEVHSFLRVLLGEKCISSDDDKIRIQYGGSVKPANAKELLSLPNVDGALVGGAALKADDFIAIIKGA
jgi:triosephosphate isomerase (TIM)